MNKPYIIFCSSFIFLCASGMMRDIPGMDSLMNRIERGDRLTRRGLNYELEVTAFLVAQGHITEKIAGTAKKCGCAQ